MRNCIKLKLVISTFLILFISHSFADQILPKSKPSVDKETKIKVSKKKLIYPQKKPEVADESKYVELENKDDKSDKEESSFIYPQKKPIVVKKQTIKKLKKSSILSKKDFNLAITSFDAIDKKNGKRR